MQDSDGHNCSRGWVGPFSQRVVFSQEQIQLVLHLNLIVPVSVSTILKMKVKIQADGDSWQKIVTLSFISGPCLHLLPWLGLCCCCIMWPIVMVKKSASSLMAQWVKAHAANLDDLSSRNLFSDLHTHTVVVRHHPLHTQKKYMWLKKKPWVLFPMPIKTEETSVKTSARRFWK